MVSGKVRRSLTTRGDGQPTGHSRTMRSTSLGFDPAIAAVTLGPAGAPAFQAGCAPRARRTTRHGNACGELRQFPGIGPRAHTPALTRVFPASISRSE